MAFSVTDISHARWMVSYALFSLSLERVLSIYLSLSSMVATKMRYFFFFYDRVIVVPFKHF